MTAGRRIVIASAVVAATPFVAAVFALLGAAAAVVGCWKAVADLLHA